MAFSLKDSIYYTPYQQLEKQGISIADWGLGKNYYGQLAFLFEDASSRNPHTEKEVGFIAELFNQHCQQMPKAILDIACGTGRHARALSAQGWKVVGIDASENLLEQAKLYDDKTRYIKNDMRNFQLNDKFSCITCIWEAYPFLSQKGELESFLKNCARHLKPGGITILDSRNFRNSSATIEFEKKVFERDSHQVRLLINRSTYLKDKIHEAIFTYFIYDTKTEEHAVIVDQELVRTYHHSEVRCHLERAGFDLLNVYGDFNLNNSFDEKKSNRQIIVAQKI